MHQKKEKKKPISEQNPWLCSQTRVGSTLLDASRVKPDHRVPKCLGFQRRVSDIPTSSEQKGKVRDGCRIPAALSPSFFLLQGFVAQTDNKNTWKVSGWQILVSQTLQAPPSFLCNNKEKDFSFLKRKEKKKDRIVEKKERRAVFFPEYQLSLRRAPRWGIHTSTRHGEEFWGWGKALGLSRPSWHAACVDLYIHTYRYLDLYTHMHLFFFFLFKSSTGS